MPKEGHRRLANCLSSGTPKELIKLLERISLVVLVKVSRDLGLKLLESVSSGQAYVQESFYLAGSNLCFFEIPPQFFFYQSDNSVPHMFSPLGHSFHNRTAMACQRKGSSAENVNTAISRVDRPENQG